MDDTSMKRVQAVHVTSHNKGSPIESVFLHFGSKKSARECSAPADRVAIENVAVPAKLRKFAPMIEMLSDHEDSFNMFLANALEAAFRLGQKHEARERKKKPKRDR